MRPLFIAPVGQFPQSGKLGKIDLWIVNYLTLAALLFASCYDVGTYILGSDTYTEGVVALLFLILVVKALAVPSVRSANSQRAVIFMALMCTVAMVNMLISWLVLQSALRWLLWFGMVFCLNRVTAASEGKWLEVLIRRLPYLFLFIYASIILTAHYVTPEDAYVAFHLSGLYGNLIFASGLFASKAWQRLMWSAVGLMAIYFSGAGGALFTIPIMFVPYILYSTTSMPVKGFALGCLFAVGCLGFFESQLFPDFLNIKVNEVNGGPSYSGMQRLENSKDMRLQLVQYGLLLVQEYPLGTGLGHTYNDNMAQGAGVGSAHNGTISMLIELGIPGFTVVSCLILWMFLCIIGNHSVPTSVRAFYFTFFFTVFGRSLSENYTPLDLGNFFTLVFSLFSIYLFLNQRMRRPSAPGPARPRGRMMIRPALRPPLPRPVGVR